MKNLTLSSRAEDFKNRKYEMNNGWGKDFTTSPTAPVAPAAPSDPRDAMSRDELLMAWQKMKDSLAALKEAELEMRRYIVKRAFPEANEGMNTVELGNGYELKAGVKFNYKLAENDKVEAGLEQLAKTGNDGSFIADRLVSWKPSFLLTEYRAIQEAAAEGNEMAKQRLLIISEFMTIDDGAAPTLEVKEPKAKKK